MEKLPHVKTVQTLMGITKVPQSNPEKVIPLSGSLAKLDEIGYHDLFLR